MLCSILEGVISLGSSRLSEDTYPKYLSHSVSGRSPPLTVGVRNTVGFELGRGFIHYGQHMAGETVVRCMRVFKLAPNISFSHSCSFLVRNIEYKKLAFGQRNSLIEARISHKWG